MKRKYIQWMILPMVLSLYSLSACTSEFPSEEGTEATLSDTKSADPIKAEVTLTTTLRLEAALRQVLGDDNWTTVQELTLKGVFYGCDVVPLHQLPALEKLNMKEAVFTCAHSEALDHFEYTFDDEGNDYNVYETVNADHHIQQTTFAGMHALKEILLPDNIVSMGGYTFYQSGITSITIPPNITTIERYSFYRCRNLIGVTLPNGLQRIEPEAFDQSSITSIVIPEGTTYVSGFSYCDSLTQVVLPSTLLEIGQGAFHGCHSLTNISLPNQLEMIGKYAFERTGIKEIIIPNKIKTIEYQTFYSCDSLKQIILPNQLETIREEAFAFTGIQMIEIPSSVTTIKSRAFQSCYQLRSITIPASVTEVEDNLFDNCYQLSAVFWYSPAEIYDSYNLNENCYLYLQSTNGQTPAWGPNWTNVIIDGVAESVTLQAQSWNQSFYCPQAFTAKKVTLTYNLNRDGYSSWSGYYTNTLPGLARGWRSFVLPFTPTSITSKEKGLLAPFGSNVEGAKPFWMRSLTPDGWKDETTMQPNKPYLLAFPCNPDLYIDEYNISGEIVFSGENVQMTTTPDPLPEDEGTDFYLVPTYKTLNDGVERYRLESDVYNDEKGNFESAFKKSTTVIYCFEAYARPKAGVSSSVLRIDPTTVKSNPVSTKSNGKRKPMQEDM